MIVCSLIARILSTMRLHLTDFEPSSLIHQRNRNPVWNMFSGKKFLLLWHDWPWSIISRHKSSTNRNDQQNRIAQQRILTSYAWINNKSKSNLPCRFIAWYCWQEYSDQYRHALQECLKVQLKRYSRLWILHCTKAQNISLAFC